MLLLYIYHKSCLDKNLHVFDDIPSHNVSEPRISLNGAGVACPSIYIDEMEVNGRKIKQPT
jgi:hypothetical protein